MKLLRDRVLIEETFTKRSSNLITIHSDKKDDYYESSKKVIGVGPKVKEVKEGDIVILVSYHNPEGEKLISGKTGDSVIVRNFIVTEGDIIAVDNEVKEKN